LFSSTTTIPSWFFVLLRERNILQEQKDCYSVNPEQSALIDYYANSIEHWWK